MGYVVAQVPSNLLLNHLGRPSLYIGFWVTAWGLVSACTSQVKNYTGILVCRLLLGLVGTHKAITVHEKVLINPRVAIFRGSVILPVKMVYQEGTFPAHVYLLFRVFTVWSFWKSDRRWYTFGTCW